MKRIANKKILLSAAIFMLAALFFVLFFVKEKKIQLAIGGNEKISEDKNGQVAVTPVNKEENNQEAMDTVSDNNTDDAENQAESATASSQKREVPEEKNQSKGKIVESLVSWGYQKAESRSIDTIVIHSSYDATSDNPYSYSGILDEYKGIGVSPHYLIDRDGKIYHLVEDKNIAYHAGTSKMPDGRTNVNGFSIGIELMNTKTSKFADKQYASLKYLISYLKGKYDIKYVLGHDDIAPGRKDDPWNFDWSRIK